MAEKMLSEKLGEVEYDGLIAGVNPKKRVGPGVIAGPEAETTFVRGTVFAKSAKDGKLHHHRGVGCIHPGRGAQRHRRSAAEGAH